MRLPQDQYSPPICEYKTRVDLNQMYSVFKKKLKYAKQRVSPVLRDGKSKSACGSDILLLLVCFVLLWFSFRKMPLWKSH